MYLLIQRLNEISHLQHLLLLLLTIVFTFRNEKLKIFENELKNCFI